MDATQKQFERAVADDFFEWFNAQHGRTYVFARRGGKGPDLVYACGSEKLGVEVTAGYYDEKHGAFLWQAARGEPNAPDSWAGVSPDTSITEAIIRRMRAKCQKRYGPRTILLINVPPGVTSAEALSQRLSEQQLPVDVPFAGIFVCGRFPTTSSSSGGYRVIAPNDRVS